MKTLTSTFSIFLVSILLLLGQVGQAQSVLDPNDPVITYNGTMPSAPLYPWNPGYSEIHKWIRTVRMDYPTDDYKAYIYKGHAFRLKFPKRYVPGVNDNLKFPMIIFFHGLAEAA